ncbi:MAG: thioredoxin family protein [Verrucomicrobiota bacterium]
MHFARSSLFLVIALMASRADAFEKGTTLPLPELVEANRFTLNPLSPQEETRVVIFYYTASWCAPCKQVSAALSSAYEDLIKKSKNLEFITYSVDQSPRARADYLRETAFDWPAISPEVIDKKPWLTKIDGGTPQFQAFEVKDGTLTALTSPGNSQEVFPVAFERLAEL